MSDILITVTLPTTRDDKSALALSDIASVTLFKATGPAAAAPLQTQHGPFTAPTVQFKDLAPDVGQDDTYTASVTDTGNRVGDMSGAITVSVPAPPPPVAVPSAPTLTAVFEP